MQHQQMVRLPTNRLPIPVVDVVEDVVEDVREQLIVVEGVYVYPRRIPHPIERPPFWWLF